MYKIYSKYSISIIIVIIFTIFNAVGLQAETIDEIQARIDIANKNRANLEKEIANYQSQLKDIGNQAITLQNTIKSLDVSTSKITTEVKLTTNNIDKTNYIIANTNDEISDKEKQINRGRRVIRDSLRQLDEADSSSVWEIILSNQNFSDFWRNIEDTILVQSKISDQIISVKDIKINLEKAKLELEQKKKELENYTNELNNKKKILVSTKQEKSTLLTTTKNTEANYQKILKDKLLLKEALDKEINQFESQLKLAVDPKSFPTASKGIFSWPLDNVYITQYFGITSVSGRLYASGSHNGVDFRAAIGTRVKAVGAGIVEGVGDTDVVCPGASYGKWVFIRYDNGLASAYGHLSLITAKAGQRVKAGDVVAYSGNTGYSTGPHLHMSVWASQGVKISTLKSTVCKGTYTMPLGDPKAYLDPMIYLPAL